MVEIHSVLYSQENTNVLEDRCLYLSYVIKNAMKEQLHHDFRAITMELLFLFPGPRITVALNLLLTRSLFGAPFQYKHKVQEGRLSATEA